MLLLFIQPLRINFPNQHIFLCTIFRHHSIIKMHALYVLLRYWTQEVLYWTLVPVQVQLCNRLRIEAKRTSQQSTHLTIYHLLVYLQPCQAISYTITQYTLIQLSYLYRIIDYSSRQKKFSFCLYFNIGFYSFYHISFRSLEASEAFYSRSMHLVMARALYLRRAHLVVPQELYFRSMQEVVLVLGLSSALIGSSYYMHSTS